jgi:NAD(P)-dependent dehydrogenase (short-subunit alcohol dehydrogenase family)
VALGLREIAKGEELASDIEAMGRRALLLQMDVLKLDEVHAAIERTVSDLGGIDILVNNVGGGVEAWAEDTSEADFDLTIDLNVKSTFFISQRVMKHMKSAGGGRIINMASQAGFVALPTESVYCLSKAAVVHMTKCLAVEWGKYGITVNAVAPTFIETPAHSLRCRDRTFGQRWWNGLLRSTRRPARCPARRLPGFAVAP